MTNTVMVGDMVEVVRGKHARALGKVLRLKGPTLQLEIPSNQRRIWVGVDEVVKCDDPEPFV